MKYTVTDSNIHIVDSCDYCKSAFEGALELIRDLYPDNQVLKRRKWWHIKLEWATHNAIHSLGLWKDRTKDVDINYPLKWYAAVAYAVCGALVWIFIK